jgi:hypothetical protein
LTLARHLHGARPDGDAQGPAAHAGEPKGEDLCRVLYHPQNLLAKRQLEIVEQLYEVAVDPQESNDLAPTMPEIAEALGKLMERYLEGCAKTATLATQKALDPRRSRSSAASATSSDDELDAAGRCLAV